MARQKSRVEHNKAFVWYSSYSKIFRRYAIVNKCIIKNITDDLSCAIEDNITSYSTIAQSNAGRATQGFQNIVGQTQQHGTLGAVPGHGECLLDYFIQEEPRNLPRIEKGTFFC